MRPCSAHRALLPKPELTLDLTEQALKIHPWWKLFFSKSAGLESIPAILLKTNSTTGIIWHGFCKVPFLIFGKLSSRYHCYFCYTGDYNSTERTRLVRQAMFIFQCRCHYQCRDADAELSKWPFINLSGTTYFVELLNGCF